MNESACGTCCEACAHWRGKECPGCGEKPGQDVTGACELARARRERGEQACSACSLRVVCGAPCGPHPWRAAQREETAVCCLSQPQRTETAVCCPSQPQRAEAAVCGPSQPRTNGHAAVNLSPEGLRLCRTAAPLLWVLFGLTIAPFVISYLFFAIRLPQDAPPVAAVLKLLCRAAVAAALFLLSREIRKYGAAAICDVISLVFSALCLFLPLSDLFVSAAALVEMILSLVSFCIQCRAHMLLAERTDPALSGKWRALRRWTLAAIFALLVNMTLLLAGIFFDSFLGFSLSSFFLVIGTLLTVFTGLAGLAIPVVFLVFLGQTASRLAFLAREAGQKSKTAG